MGVLHNNSDNTAILPYSFCSAALFFGTITKPSCFY